MILSSFTGEVQSKVATHIRHACPRGRYRTHLHTHTYARMTTHADGRTDGRTKGRLTDWLYNMGQVLKSTRRQRVGQSQLDKKEKDPKMKRIKKIRFRPGTREGVPFGGPFLYALAGRSTKFELTLVQRFDVTTGQWTPGPALDAPRAAFAVARAHDRIYVMGGSLNFEPLASVRSLAPYGPALLDKQGVEILPKWRVESPMPYPRRFFAAVSWRPAAGDGGVGGGGREQEAVFILGGAGKFYFADSAVNDVSYSSVQSYDGHRRVWVNHTGMPM